MIDRGRVLRRLLRFSGRLPTHIRALHPLWLSAQLDTVVDYFESPHVTKDMDGLRIAYASDIHYGPLLGKDRLHTFAERFNALEADIILLGGDFGEDIATAIACVRALPKLTARLGCYAAMGNHDHMGSPDEYAALLEAMRERQWTPLVNSAHSLRIGESTLCLCATDDHKLGKPDFAPLIAPSQEADFCLYAPHSPDALPVALEQAGFTFHLMLAGHTHGGQLTIMDKALHSSSRYGNRYLSGWMEEGGKSLMVSNGVGCSLLPLRMGARAQIHLITLRWLPSIPA